MSIGPCTETTADTLLRRLARFFARVPCVLAVAVGTSWDCDPPRPMLVVLLSRDLLEIPVRDGVDGMEYAERACRRVARLLGIHTLRSAFDAQVLRDTEAVYRSPAFGAVIRDCSDDRPET